MKNYLKVFGVIMMSLLLTACNSVPTQSTVTNMPTVMNTPTLEPTGTNTPTPMLEPTVTNTPTPTLEPTGTNTPTPTLEPTATNTPTPTLEPTATNIPTPTLEPTGTNTPTPTLEPAVTNTPTPTLEPTATSTPTPSPVLVKIYTGSVMIVLGMDFSELDKEMGTVSYKIPAEYEGCEWYVYNTDYTKFTMVLVKESKVVGAFVDGQEFQFGNINTSTTKKDIIEMRFASTWGRKEKYTKNEENCMITVYLDTLEDNTVEGVLVTEKLDSKIDDTVIAGFEKVAFDVANSFRVKHGIAQLIWSEEVANVARLHSIDMKENNYFDHTSLSGTSPGERLTSANLIWRAYAENIAAGYTDGVDVTYGWINSEGHRNNLLFEAVKYLGVGVSSTYYTQVFYTPMQ